jgi:hypothetical protein
VHFFAYRWLPVTMIHVRCWFFTGVPVHVSRPFNASRAILMALGSTCSSLVAPLLLLTVTSATGLTLGTRSHLTSRRAVLCGAGALVACRSAASAAPKKETLLERVARVDRESGQERNSQGSPEDRMPRLTVFGTQTKVTTSGLNCACEMTVPQRDISSEQVTAGEELPYVELL